MVSRRQFLKGFGVGVAAATTALDLGVPSMAAAVFEPQRATQPRGFILLNSNENPYGPSPAVMAALQGSLAAANRYPDRAYEAFVDRVAKLHNVAPSHVVPGCGSTEILRLAATAFLGPGKKLIHAVPTFEAIVDYANSVSAEAVPVALTSNYAHDLEAMLARVDQNTTLVYVCNPNNPTGSLTPRKHLETFIQTLPQHIYVVIDEAYHHYATSPDYVSFLDRALEDPRLIVARTFSKVYGMAGIRIGYGIAAAETIQKLSRYKLQDNLSVLAATAGVAALDDSRGTLISIQRNTTTREDFQKQAVKRGLKPIPSYANFVMMETNRPVGEVIGHFKKNQILIGRPFPPMTTYARVSLGTPDEMQEFWKVWDGLAQRT